MLNLLSTYIQKKKLNTNTNEMETIKPFHNILKDIQEKRRVFPKGHINNMLYKEMGMEYMVTYVGVFKTK
jgi:hypothetical protein